MTVEVKMASFPDAGPDDARFVGHIVLDTPAKRPTLGFAQIAEALAAVVQASEPRFAVGIFGGWGSGKSTLMEEIERLVMNQQQAIIVKFNAWRYEREPHLIVPLLDTIRATLSEWAARRAPNDPRGAKVRELARRIGRVVRALVRATSVDIGLRGAVVLNVQPGKVLDDMSEEPENTAASPQSLYFAAFEELSAAFADIASAGLSRIIVFVDDLDRCLPDRALTVLESMKLFFDMPGFIFIVGLDEQVVNSAVRTKFGRQQQGEAQKLDRLVEVEYPKKIFQVPYTLPAMVPAQLDDLLRWMADYGQLGEIQREDLKIRVRNFLRYVATEGRINPREVKRYINAYTLHRMIRPDLEPDTMLALQTFDFRRDWEQVYEDVVLAEPDVFVEVLGRFRAGDNHAFEDLWPEIGVLPLELAEFLRSDEASALAGAHDVERYVSLLETTRSSHTWVKEAMHDVGLLRRHMRQIRPPLQFGDDAARDKAVHLKDILGRLASYQSGIEAGTLAGPLEKMMGLLSQLAPSGTTDGALEETTPEQLEEWRQKAMAETNYLQQELSLIRRSSAFGAR
jgi:hypothetical protein